MKYLVNHGDYATIGRSWDDYMAYLQTVKTKLPSNVYEFATASWHYDPRDHRSLHDSWVERLSVREIAHAERNRARVLALEIELLAPYHDGSTTLVYETVTRYELLLPAGATQGHRPVPQWHGDWNVDEIRLSAAGNVEHEILFSTGASWLIECATFSHATTVPHVRHEARDGRINP